MNEIVTIYKTRCFASFDPSQEGESCSLLPWDSTDPECRGKDDGGRDYILPAGYTQSRAESGVPVILGEEGNPCELLLHDGCPLLIDAKKRLAHLLEPVKKMATFREAMGMTRAQLAEQLGVSQTDVYEWENVEKEPDAAMMERIAKALHCKAEELR